MDKRLILRKGIRGKEVCELQKYLDVDVDGKFGVRTQIALKQRTGKIKITLVLKKKKNNIAKCMFKAEKIVT
jgi:hypothetical protein